MIIFVVEFVDVGPPRLLKSFKDVTEILFF